MSAAQEMSVNSPDMQAQYFSPCAAPSSFNNCCYAVWCAPCYAGQIKAHLDGREYDCCDCLCTYPDSSLFIRRQLRAKYGLKQDIVPGGCGLGGTYWEDVWLPCLFGGCLSIPSAVLKYIPAFPSSVVIKAFTEPLPTLASDFLIIASDSEQKLRNGAAPFTYRADGSVVPLHGKYQIDFGHCFGNCESCLYVTCCGPCALGHMAALLHGRECDICDCVNSPLPYVLRKSLKAKYGIPQDSCTDCCLSTCCAPCVICQDYRELQVRATQTGSRCYDAFSTAETAVGYPMDAPLKQNFKYGAF
ncbi:hypothetical protein CYMTET_6164 [Cymbomonas tetramitiformis]|uniref:Uncharacterized protein n=1 Tax=Cymbomonas tetramitiformis TaxID=36881 RepID=A0AAE0GXP0_9CHLO|nr:hypothetical protein CYMTET_6164 [Cymbomonas tetramitiformis]